MFRKIISSFVIINLKLENLYGAIPKYICGKNIMLWMESEVIKIEIAEKQLYENSKRSSCIVMKGRLQKECHPITNL